jgi:hypothetical protein
LVEIAESGGVVRFAVGAPGNRGLVWRLWANESKADFYLAVRTGGGVLKYSFHAPDEFHATGIWRLAHTSEYAAALGETNRVKDVWPPAEPAGDGLIYALTIRTPASEVVPIPGDDPADTAITYVRSAQAGQVLDLHVVIMRPDEGLKVSAGSIVDGILLADDTLVLLVSEAHDLTPEESLHIAQLRKMATDGLKSLLPDEPHTSDLRATPHGHMPNGHRFVWDIAVFPPDEWARAGAPAQDATTEGVETARASVVPRPGLEMPLAIQSTASRIVARAAATRLW